MSIRIMDTFSEIGQCFDETGFCKEKWNQYILHCLPYAQEMIEQDSADYDFEKQVLPVLNNVRDREKELGELHDSFLFVINGLEERIEQTLKTKLDAVIVLYLGLCNGAGWVVSFREGEQLLLGVEKILELGWFHEYEMKGLIYHELGHVWHKQCRTNPFPSLNTSKDKALWQLYSEGVAMYCEQLLCKDEQFYHQDQDGWLNWCRKNRTLLFREYIRVLEKKESHQKFFGDWCSYLNVSDTGYYLGCELVKKAFKTNQDSSILDLSLNEIESILYQCLDS